MTTSVSGLPDPVAAALHSAFGSPRVSDTASYSVRKVGRNQVWEVTSCEQSKKRCYAKWWPSPQMFQRELGGLDIINRLAARHSWLLPAPVIFADEANGVIVVREVHGVDGSHLISQALRRFQRTMKRETEKAFRCLSLILQFLEQLHRVEVRDSSHLAAHDPMAVLDRVNGFAERLRNHPAWDDAGVWDAFPLSLNDFQIAEMPALCVLHGDPTPVNFIIDDSRVGVLDFEDMGVGPACRDLLWIDYCLEQYDRMWHYRSGARLRRLVPQTATDPGVLLLYRLECLLLHLTAIATRPAATTAVTRYFDWMERTQVVRSLRRHCDLVFHGGRLQPAIG